MKKTKLLVAAYLAALCLIFSFVPWQGRIPASVGNTKKTATLELGYAWINSPPPGAKRINYRHLLAELIIVSTAAGIIFYYLRRRG